VSKRGLCILGSYCVLIVFSVLVWDSTPSSIGLGALNIFFVMSLIMMAHKKTKSIEGEGSNNKPPLTYSKQGLSLTTQVSYLDGLDNIQSWLQKSKNLLGHTDLYACVMQLHRVASDALVVNVSANDVIVDDQVRQTYTMHLPALARVLNTISKHCSASARTSVDTLIQEATTVTKDLTDIIGLYLGTHADSETEKASRDLEAIRQLVHPSSDTTRYVVERPGRYKSLFEDRSIRVCDALSRYEDTVETSRAIRRLHDNYMYKPALLRTKVCTNLMGSTLDQAENLLYMKKHMGDNGSGMLRKRLYHLMDSLSNELMR